MAKFQFGLPRRSQSVGREKMEVVSKGGRNGEKEGKEKRTIDIGGGRPVPSEEVDARRSTKTFATISYITTSAFSRTIR